MNDRFKGIKKIIGTRYSDMDFDEALKKIYANIAQSKCTKKLDIYFAIISKYCKQTSNKITYFDTIDIPTKYDNVSWEDALEEILSKLPRCYSNLELEVSISIVVTTCRHTYKEAIIMLSEDRCEEIWEEVADELYNKNFDFSDLEMECEADQEDDRWGMPMYMAGGYTNQVTVKYTFDSEELAEYFDGGDFDLKKHVTDFFKYCAKKNPEVYAEKYGITLDPEKEYTSIDALASIKVLSDEEQYADYLRTVISDAAEHWYEKEAESELEDAAIEKGEVVHDEPDYEDYRGTDD